MAITNASSFTFCQFQSDLVGATPNSDTGSFFHFPNLGVDRHAVYVGGNVFTSLGILVGTTGFVIHKANLLAGSLTVTAFRQLVRAFPDHETMPSAAVQAARLLIEMKSYDEPAAVLKPVVERRRDHRLAPEARYMLGLAHLSAGKTTEGIADLRALVAAHPTHDMAGQARRLIVDTLLKQGKKDDLAREYKTLMAQSPLTAEGLYDAGLLASRLGRPKDAEQAWTDLRSDFPDSPLAARASLDLAQAVFKRGASRTRPRAGALPPRARRLPCGHRRICSPARAS